MLTFNFDRLSLKPGDRVIDIGAGNGRHSFEALRRGAWVVALDHEPEDLATATAMAAAMVSAGEAPATGGYRGVSGDALQLPFPDAYFDRVIAAEVLEHISDDRHAIHEMARVVRPGGTAVVTVPRWFPELVCWALSDEYHRKPGGHVRIYRGTELRAKLESAGFRCLGTQHSHALHAPYWWLKCALGISDEAAVLPRLYHRFLVWDIVRRPRGLRVFESILNPVLGKSLVLYLEKAC